MGKWWNWAPGNTSWHLLSERALRANDEEEYREAIIHTNVNNVSIALLDDGQLRPD